MQRASDVQVSREFWISSSSIQLLQEQNEDDFGRRLQFCEIVSELANHKVNFYLLAILKLSLPVPILEFFILFPLGKQMCVGRRGSHVFDPSVQQILPG